MAILPRRDFLKMAGLGAAGLVLPQTQAWCKDKTPRARPPPQRRHHPDRRPGLRRFRLPRQPGAQDPQPGRHARPVGALHGLPRRAGLHPHPQPDHDRPRLSGHRRLLHLLRPRVHPPGRADHGRRLRRLGLPHRPVRQVAPGRQLPLPPAGSRVSGILHLQWLGDRFHIGALGQRIHGPLGDPQRAGRGRPKGTATTSFSTKP